LNAKKKQLLLEFPWGEHFPKLVAFAEWCIQGKQWNSGLLPMGHTAESIVQDVITKTFSEERNWDPEKGDLLKWLKYVIRSEISHLSESIANKVEVPLDQSEENDSPADGSVVEQRQPSSHRLMTGSPEEVVIAAETEAEKMAEAQSKIDALLEASSGHPELEEIVYAIVDGKCDPKPQKLAEFLGRPVGEINQNLRTLRRRAEKIRVEVRNGRE
jgi:DNA-directed RNA polymerase specialized sigma24 family protein